MAAKHIMGLDKFVVNESYSGESGGFVVFEGEGNLCSLSLR